MDYEITGAHRDTGKRLKPIRIVDVECEKDALDQAHRRSNGKLVVEDVRCLGQVRTAKQQEEVADRIKDTVRKKTLETFPPVDYSMSPMENIKVFVGVFFIIFAFISAAGAAVENSIGAASFAILFAVIGISCFALNHLSHIHRRETYTNEILYAMWVRDKIE